MNNHRPDLFQGYINCNICNKEYYIDGTIDRDLQHFCDECKVLKSSEKCDECNTHLVFKQKIIRRERINQQISSIKKFNQLKCHRCLIIYEVEES